MSKRVFLLFFTLAIALLFVFLVLNPSYRKSVEARFLLFNEEYEDALRLAKEGYVLDPYNKMSISVINSAAGAIEYISYIEQSKEYLNSIILIANSKTISDEDRKRVRMMCEYMIERYDILRNTRTADIGLRTEAKEQYEKFKEIYEEVF